MKKIILSIVLLVIASCNTSEININEKIIKQLSEGDFKIPSAHGFALLFVSSKKNEKGHTNVNVLHEIFLKYYATKYSDFKSFLSDVLNQKRSFSQERLDEWGVGRFELNNGVEDKYNQLSMSGFIKEYFDLADDKSKFVVKSKYSEEVYSILYYCFINNYKITLDDFRGKYFISKSNTTAY